LAVLCGLLPQGPEAQQVETVGVSVGVEAVAARAAHQPP